MSLTRIGSIGINTGIAFAGVTTIVTLNTANDALSIGATVNVGSGITLGASGDIFATGVSTFSGNLKVGSGVTISPDGDIFATGVTTSTTFSGAFSGSGANITALNASNISSGTVPTARLGSGTASSSTFLRGDSTFAAVTSTTINSNADNRVITGSSSANTLNAESNLTYNGGTTFTQTLDDNTAYSATATTQMGFQAHNQSNTTNSYSALRLTAGSSSPATAQISSLYTGAGQNDLTFQLETSNTAFEAMRITSSGRLGIGENSPDTLLHVKSADNILATFESTDADALIEFKDNSTSDTIIIGAVTGDDLLFRTDAGKIVFSLANNTEKMRLDSSGRLLIGTTTEGYADADDLTIGTSGNSGITIRSGTSNSSSIFFSDATSGSGEYNGYIQQNHADDLMQIGINGTRKINITTAGLTFNNDTASANALDDYEEGTWTAALHSGETCTNNQSTYTRIGRLVVTNCYISNFSDFNGNGAEFRITGLPFDAHNAQGGSYHGGGYISYAASWNYSYPLLPLVGSNNNYIYFHRQDGTTASWKYQDFHNTSNGSGGALIVQMVYETDY